MKFFRLVFIALLVLVAPHVWATHLKGGEITVKRISDKTLTFEFTLTTYTEDNRANFDQNFVFFCFGDGTSTFRASRVAQQTLENGTIKNTYKIQYTYPAAALSYKVSVAIPNRNEGVRNISNSVQVAFYVETTFSINAGLGQNSTPILLNPAVDLTAVVGQRFIHNPNAVDAEGDSLAYRLTVSRTGIQEICNNRGQICPGFVQPNEIASSPSSFTIDAKTGDLIWDVPKEVGKYNTAFVVEEWRNGIKISETVRDMQIEVKDLNNRGPVLSIPPDVCVAAGTRVNATITAVDVASSSGRLDPLTITSSGMVYQGDTTYSVKAPFASFASAPRQASPASGTFNWITACQHIRKEPYDVLFKAVDNPPLTSFGLSDRLVDSKVWRIKVTAAAPKNLQAQLLPGLTGVSLNWSAYDCNLSNAKLVLFKKNGNCVDVPNNACSTGMSLPGFSPIARLDIGTTSYTDKSNIQSNGNYVYVLVVEFINSKGNTDFSPMSNAACVSVPTSSPLMTNVSVTKTDAKNGSILVRWSRPNNLDTKVYPGPYFYQVMRVEGATSSNYLPISSLIPTNLSANQNDTTYVDSGMNTFSSVHYYQVKFYYTRNGQVTLLETANPASNVYLFGSTKTNAITLNWFADVPWSNDFQVHRVYREQPRGSGKFNQIADVSVAGQNTFLFTDQGTDFVSSDGKFDLQIKKDSSYCYYVETLGAYGKGFPVFKLINASQIICFKAIDNGTGENGNNPGNGGGGGGGGNTDPNLSPCAPELSLKAADCAGLDNADCNTSSYTNFLSWKAQVAAPCDPSIARFKVFYNPNQTGTFNLIKEQKEAIFNHQKSDGIKGCYYVTAVSTAGKESPASKTICIDNCPSFDLPNLFSPNGDGKNDVWLPLRCPKFVRQIKAVLVDRYGQPVYQYQGPLQGFGWDGTYQGKPMASGSYFYQVELEMDAFDEKLQSKSLKGWIELIR